MNCIGIHCCEGGSITIKKCSSRLWCCCRDKEEGTDSDDASGDGVHEVVYLTAPGPDQFVLLNTPFVEVDRWVRKEQLPFNTTTVFFKDEDGELRVLMHHDPHDRRHRTSSSTSSSSNLLQHQAGGDTPRTSPSAPPPCEVNEGVLVTDILPVHLHVPIIRFMEDTLDGMLYQMHGLFNTVAKLIRTFPIFNSTNQVVGGIMIIGPFTPTPDGDRLDQFALNLPGGEDTEDNGPPRQEMRECNEEASPYNMPPTKHMGIDSLRKGQMHRKSESY